VTDDAVDVEMTVDPDNSGNDLVNPNSHVALFRYEAQDAESGHPRGRRE
jgi:hypothetical protein